MQYSYDDELRQSTATLSIGAEVVARTDASGHYEAIGVNLPSGDMYETSYMVDEHGRLIELVDPFGASTTYEYDDFGRLAARHLPNGVTSEYMYNVVDELVSLLHRDGAGQIIASYTYERLPGGAPSRLVREDGSSTVYAYDQANRLVSERHLDAMGELVWANEYAYDASGNRTSWIARDSNDEVIKNEEYQYYHGTYRLAAIVEDGDLVSVFEYDDAGHMTAIITAEDRRELTYDVNGRLISVDNDDFLDAYAYNGLDQRVQSTDGDGGTLLRLMGNGPDGLAYPQAILDDVGTLVDGYGYDDRGPLFRYDAQGDLLYYLEDGLGSIVGLSDGGGNLVGAFTYDAFGNIVEQSGTLPESGLPGAGVDGDFRFQGLWLDGNTGLYDARARWYDPQIGRFVSEDPVAPDPLTPETMNVYAFAHNNPLMFEDATGQIATYIEALIVSAVRALPQGARQVILQQVKAEARETAQEMAVNFLVNQITRLVKPDSLLPGVQDVLKNFSGGAWMEPWRAGRLLGNVVEDSICNVLQDPGWVFFEPWIEVRSGDPASAGINCAQRHQVPRPIGNAAGILNTLGGINVSLARPDLVFGNWIPASTTDGDVQRHLGAGGRDYYPARKNWTIGEVKLRVLTAYDGYVGRYRNNRDNQDQFQAILRYAKNRTLMRTAFILTLTPGLTGKNKNALLHKAKQELAKEAWVKYDAVLLTINLTNRNFIIPARTDLNPNR